MAKTTKGIIGKRASKVQFKLKDSNFQIKPEGKYLII